MNRAKILSNHMELIERHHVATHNAYLNKPCDRDGLRQKMMQARNAVIESAESNGITRAELTAHSKRNTIVASNVFDAMDKIALKFDSKVKQ